MAEGKEEKMLNYPQELKYVKTHEYVLVKDGQATIGITAFAADQLGDVTFVELPKPGTRFKKEEKFGVIESVKSVSDLFMPLGGEIVAVNQQLESEPELVNLDCYGDGWMIKVKMDNPADLNQAMSAAEYQDFIVD